MGGDEGREGVPHHQADLLLLLGQAGVRLVLPAGAPSHRDRLRVLHHDIACYRKRHHPLRHRIADRFVQGDQLERVAVPHHLAVIYVGVPARSQLGDLLDVCAEQLVHRGARLLVLSHRGKPEGPEYGPDEAVGMLEVEIGYVEVLLVLRRIEVEQVFKGFIVHDVLRA